MPSFWKPDRRRVDRRRKRAREREEDIARAQVRLFWNFRCRVCGRQTSTVHEHKRRGAGGKVSLTNSFLACDLQDGGVCHPLLQDRYVNPRMANGAETFDASAGLIFEMNWRAAKLIFGSRSLPAHVRIVE